MKTLARMITLSIVLLVLISTSEAQTPATVYRDAVKPHWLPDGQALWYKVQTPGNEHQFILVDAQKGTRLPAFDHADVARKMTHLGEKDIQAHQLPIETLRFSPDRQTVDMLGTSASWQFHLETGQLINLDESALAQGLPFSLNPRPHTRTGPHTFVTFINRLEQAVSVWWIDGSGGRHKYADLAHNQRHRQHTYSGHMWLVLGNDGAVVAVFEAADEESLAVIDGREPDYIPPPPVPETVSVAVPSPDGKQAVFVRNHNLWLRDLESGQESRLSMDGRANDSYRKDGQRPRLVEMEYGFPAPADSVPDVYWSPDSRYLMALRTRQVKERAVHMINSAPDDQLEPRLESYPYLKPGDDIPVGLPHLFDTLEKRQIPLNESLYDQPWSIDNFHWTPSGDRVFFLYNQRGHQIMRVISVTAASGHTQAVVDEQSDTFFDYQGKTYLEHLDDTDELIWMSERDGWNHLYLYDRSRLRVKKQITRGKWVVRSVEKVNTENRNLRFQLMGYHSDQDPYLVHQARIDLNGKNLTLLTEGNGTHQLDFSPDEKYFVSKWSRVDQPPVHELRDGKSGALICLLEEADASEILASGRQFPEPFVAAGRDGQTPIHGIIHRPTNFDPSAKYPVVEYIYAGPHNHHVPKGFRAQYRLQPFIDMGFIVVQIDGMGTSWRSKDFHDVCWQNLVDGGFPDRVAWIKAAAQKEPAMDLSRVGIFGGSAGGQNALAAMLTHGDFYQAAMADCGCHDNRMDKIWWNEQWMGYPIGPHYSANSNVTLAHQLQGNLLLIVGELDRNVDPASTMQVVDALVKADKDFEMLVIPGAGHGASGTPYGRRRTAEFFVRHLKP